MARRLRIDSSAEVPDGSFVTEVVFVDEDGNPVEIGGGSEPVVVAWGDVTGKPSTFPPTIGTTATTAKAGNYAPAWGDVTGKPSTFAPGTHTHTVANVTGLQDILDDLEQRLAAVEETP